MAEKSEIARRCEELRQALRDRARKPTPPTNTVVVRDPADHFNPRVPWAETTSSVIEWDQAKRVRA